MTDLTITQWPSLDARIPGRRRRVSWPVLCAWLALDWPAFAGDGQQPGWSPGTFAQDHRSGNCVEQIHALGLDLDHCETLGEALAPWAGLQAVWHTTRVHEHVCDRNPIGGPRARVIVSLSRAVSGAEYRRLWQWAQARSCGILDRAAPNPDRFWFLPGSAVGDPVESGTIEGQPLDVDTVLAEIDAAAPEPEPAIPVRVDARSGDRCGDDFKRRATWAGILEPHGWHRFKRVTDGSEHWTRPGKRDGTSATISADGRHLFVFTSGAPPLEACSSDGPRKCYDKLGAFAALNHSGNISEAIRALVVEGYGDAPKPRGDWTPERCASVDDGVDEPDEYQAPPDDPTTVEQPPDDDWRRLLLTRPGKDGPNLIQDPANGITILQHHPAWHGVLGWDSFRLSVVTSRRPPWHPDDAPLDLTAGQWTDRDSQRLSSWFMRTERLRISVEAAARVADVASAHNAMHPIRDYLSALRWDGVSRLDEWIPRYLGADDTLYARLVGRWFLVSACARIFDPGCKVDTMPILEGPQGARKSSALSALFGRDWFSDTPLDLESKDRFTSLRGRWCVELAELDSMRRSDTSRIKSFLSSACDSYRPPYGRADVHAPRQVVFCGTVNGHSYLRDDTGNRRFWPVRCGTIDLGELGHARDQLWAEAKESYAGGAHWWPEGRGENDLCREAQDERGESDVWQESVDRYLERQGLYPWITVPDVLTNVIGLEKGRWTQTDQNRIARCVSASGWLRVQRRIQGVRVWGYCRPVTSVTSSKELLVTTGDTSFGKDSNA